MTDAAFGRCVVLFHATVDALFAGPLADQVKHRAVRIAMTMQYHIKADAAVGVGGKMLG